MLAKIFLMNSRDVLIGLCPRLTESLRKGLRVLSFRVGQFSKVVLPKRKIMDLNFLDCPLKTVALIIAEAFLDGLLLNLFAVDLVGIPKWEFHLF